jgi:hypothetical protein
MSTRTIQVERPARFADSFGAAVGIALIAAYVVALFLLMDFASYDAWGALLVAPVLIAFTVPMLAREARREQSPSLFRLLSLALFVKLAGALARYYVAFSVYARSDAQAYHEAGIVLGPRFRHLDFSTVGVVRGGEGTRFVKLVAGAVYAVIGPTRLGAFLVFSWFGFLGLYFFYRAFVIAVPSGRARSYAHFVFFLPSLVFWPSSLGKEGWMMLTVGLASLGVARLLTGALREGLIIGGLGVWGAGFVRPHIAALIGVAFAFAMVTRRTGPRLRELAPLVKVLTIGAVCVLAVVLALRTATFLQKSGIETEEGFSATAADVQERTSSGGSEFTPASVADSPLNLPEAAITVLFRPFPIEAHNAQALASALEGAFLMLVVVLRFRWIATALRSARTTPYLVFAITYTVLFIVGYSTFSNFGILARERVQLYPLFLVLLSVPPADRPIRPDQAMRRRQEADARV